MNAPVPFPGSAFGQLEDELQALPDEVAGEDEFSSWYEEDTPELVAEQERATAKIVLTDRDVTLLRFLIRYGYANADALALLVNSTRESIQKRLRQLTAAGFVRTSEVVRHLHFYLPTRTAMNLLGQTFAAMQRPPFATIQHTVGLGMIGAALEREYPDSDDVLGFRKRGEQWPQQRRFKGGLHLWDDPDEYQNLMYGEMTLTEREVRQGQQRWRNGRSTREMRDAVHDAAQDPSAPELDDGNQGYFVVYGEGGKTGEFIPDLVVTRAREDGRPAHIAVELELTLKNQSELVQKLRGYRNNGWMYEQVIWLTHRPEISRALAKANESVGLENMVIGRFKPSDDSRLFLG